MNKETTKDIIPSYNEVVDEIVTQIKGRSKDILKRALFIIWPYLILFVAVFVFIAFDIRSNVDGYSSLMLVYKIFFVVWLVISIFYSFIVRELFSLEKVVWVDSYFDKKNLDSKRSFLVAKKVFWSAIGKKIMLFSQYYFLPITLYFIAVGASFYAMNVSQSFSGTRLNLLFWVVLSGGLVLIWIYFYYLEIKLRYFWFIFLDNYGKKDLAYKKILEETKRLGKVNEKEVFKKTFILIFSADSLNELSKSIANKIIKELENLDGGLNVTGSATKEFSNEILYQITSLSKITAKYIFYQHARKKMGLTEQNINNNIYNID